MLHCSFHHLPGWIGMPNGGLSSHPAMDFPIYVVVVVRWRLVLLLVSIQTSHLTLPKGAPKLQIFSPVPARRPNYQYLLHHSHFPVKYLSCHLHPYDSGNSVCLRIRRMKLHIIIPSKSLVKTCWHLWYSKIFSISSQCFLVGSISKWAFPCYLHPTLVNLCVSKGFHVFVS